MNSSIAMPILHQSRSLYLRRTVPNDAGLLFDKGFSQREFMRLFRLNDAPTSEAQVHRHYRSRISLNLKHESRNYYGNLQRYRYV